MALGKGCEAWRLRAAAPAGRGPTGVDEAENIEDGRKGAMPDPRPWDRVVLALSSTTAGEVIGLEERKLVNIDAEMPRLGNPEAMVAFLGSEWELEEKSEKSREDGPALKLEPPTEALALAPTGDASGDSSIEKPDAPDELNELGEAWKPPRPPAKSRPGPEDSPVGKAVGPPADTGRKSWPCWPAAPRPAVSSGALSNMGCERGGLST